MAASADAARVMARAAGELLLFCTVVAAQAPLPGATPPKATLPAGLMVGLLAGVSIVLAMWRHERRLRRQREVLRHAYGLGEEILGCSSADQILTRVRLVVPKIFGVSDADLYLYNPHTKSLDSVVRGREEPISIPLSAPPAGPPAGAVACFHYRTLLAIPDTSRSPFPVTGSGPDVPRSLMFVPMLVQGDVTGILEMDRRDRARDFTRDDQAIAQHLANQIGVAVKLLDQRSVREQLFRTEKLAAVGQLISGIVNDLQTPLAAIGNLAQPALSGGHDTPEEKALAAIAAEARRASGIVTRLVGFAASGPAEPQPVEINALLRNLIEFREREWIVRGIRVHRLLSDGPLTVVGSHGQLEQVFLNLLVHAEQALSDASEKIITIRTSQIARRILIEIGYSGPKSGGDPFSSGPAAAGGSAGLGVCRSLITSHGGEIRLVQPVAAEPMFQIELPSAGREKAAGPAPENGRNGTHPLTALLIGLDEAAKTQLQAMLASRSYRVVPTVSSDEGLDLAQRLRFDAVFCSVHAPGLNWVETAEQVKSRVGAFVLVSDTYGAEMAADFESENRFVLAKPVDERELDRILTAMQPHPQEHPPGR